MFPDVSSLANASEEEVLRLWQGLGYYSRARNLHRCAKILLQEKSGNFPKTYAELIKLPGIGPYTGAAIASFAFGEQVAVVDGNVLRVLARVFGLRHDIKKAHTSFRALANALIPEDTPGDFNQAIMEFGALQCSPGLPDCDACPLKAHCYAFAHNMQTTLPVKSKKAPAKKRYFHYVVIREKDRLYMRPRAAGDIWQGLYDFPVIEKEAFLRTEELLRLVDQLLDQRNYTVEEVSPVYQHVLSHQKIHAKFIQIDLTGPSGQGQGYLAELKPAGPSAREKLPKPVLISRYLNDHNF